MSDRFIPQKRTALDDVTWWCIFDTVRGAYSTYLCHGKYRTKRQALHAIELGKIIYGVS